MDIDYTEYGVMLFGKDVPEGLKKYRNIEIEGKTLIFIPQTELDAETYEDKRIKFTWSFMLPTLQRLINEHWEFDFENDSDWDELQEISENANSQSDVLFKIKEYFNNTYRDNNDNPDPILLSRLIITPRNSDYSFIFYYGETVSLENNSTDDIKHLFEIIIMEMKLFKGIKVK